VAYNPRLPPAEFQEIGLRKSAGKSAFAWLMEMGTRKTATTLIEWMKLVEAGELNDLLVIAPGGCYRNWCMDLGEEPSECRKHLDPALFERTLLGTWMSGAGKRHKEDLERLIRAPHDRPRILAVNVEAIRVQKARELCDVFLSRRKAMCVVDESPIIKNDSAPRTKIVQSFGTLAPYRRILSGLVTPNSPLDLYPQFAFLDWRILGQRSFFGFRNRYAIIKKMQFQNHTAQVVVGYRNEVELAERIKPFSYRVLKADVLNELPAKTYMPVRHVDMTSEQQRVYQELKQQATAQLEMGSWISPQLPITLMLRLHQVLCGHVTDDNGITRHIATHRVDALLGVLHQHTRKAIIWVHYEESIKLIAERLKQEYGPRSVATFYGGNRSTRHEDEARFKGDSECRFMVASQGAGGRGNNWTMADLVVYYASTHNLDHRAQSEDRTHRDGQTRSVVYVDLAVPNTVDTKILKALREKINLAAVINGDNWREWVV
jgi:SNF2 family DNA or RNA helicase